MSRTFEKSKLAVNRKRSAVDCSLFEARGPKLAAVCSKVCVRFFRTYEYTPCTFRVNYFLVYLTSSTRHRHALLAELMHEA